MIIVEVNKKELLAILNIKTEPCIYADATGLKRGWYICLDEAIGDWYLNNCGYITKGTRGSTNSFWPTKKAAEKFLNNWEKTEACCMPVYEPVIETCEQGHVFAKLPDHPKNHGVPRCPYCMAIGLDAARAKNEAKEDIKMVIRDKVNKDLWHHIHYNGVYKDGSGRVALIGDECRVVYVNGDFSEVKKLK